MARVKVNRTFLRRLLAWLSLVGATTSALVLAEEVRIPGTSVTLDAPAGFAVSRSFAGLESARDGSSITVAELPLEGYDQLLPVFESLSAAVEAFTPKGVVIERAEAYDVGGEKVPVLVGKQGTAAGDVAKYLALYRGGTTVLLTFNVFDSEHLSPGAVEAVMRSVRLSAPLTLQQQVDALPFAFEVAPPFRLSGVLGGSAVLLTTFEGTDPSGTKPAIIIARSLSPVAPTPAAEEVNERLLQSTRGFEGAEVLVRQAAQFGGGAASYLEARSGTRKLLHYVRVAPDGMYLRLAAFGDGDALAGVSAAVAAIAASVAPR